MDRVLYIGSGGFSFRKRALHADEELLLAIR